MDNSCRACWQNCGVEADAEMIEIDRMEDAILPLDKQTTRIRELITRYEACYHEADKEAERIVMAIGTGICPEETHERPPERKKELENCRRILSRWCEDPGIGSITLDVGGIDADLLASLGAVTPEKRWLAASLDKTIRLQLDAPPDFWLSFS